VKKKPFLWRTWRKNLAWQVEFLDSAQKQFAKLDTTMQRRVLKFLFRKIGPEGAKHTSPWQRPGKAVFCI